MEACKISNMYTLSETIAAGLFEGAEYPWEVLPKIHDFILELGKSLPADKFEKEARISGLQNLQRLLPQPA